MGRALLAHTFTYLRAPYAALSDQHDTNYLCLAPSHPSRHFRPCSPSTSSPRLSFPRDASTPLTRSLSAGRFFAVGTISLCQTGGLICEAFAGTPRPRIIIKIPHRRPRSLAPACRRTAAFTFRDITFHSELDQSFNGRKFNLCAATK